MFPLHKRIPVHRIFPRTNPHIGQFSRKNPARIKGISNRLDKNSNYTPCFSKEIEELRATQLLIFRVFPAPTAFGRGRYSGILA
jgi:hypothetical protein